MPKELYIQVLDTFQIQACPLKLHLHTQKDREDRQETLKLYCFDLYLG